MSYEKLHLGHSPLTDQVYIGRLNKDKTQWLEKRNMTHEFIDCVIGRWNGYVETIRASNGKVYEVSVKEISK